MKSIFAKGLFLLFTLTVKSYVGYSQIDHISVMVGKPENTVRKYLDSLNQLKSNPYYKIKSDVSKEGDQILKVSFALADEAYYGCLDIILKFQRTKDSVEVCTDQIIGGKSEYAYRNVSYLKDNFKFVSTNYWEKSCECVFNAIIAANFVRQDNDSYYIRYSLVK